MQAGKCGVPEAVIAGVLADIEAEVDSIRLYDWAAVLWQSLRPRGLKAGICSNLAALYGLRFSQVGQQKLETEIYHTVARYLKIDIRHRKSWR